jgi:hypothetical protein
LEEEGDAGFFQAGEARAGHVAHGAKEKGKWHKRKKGELNELGKERSCRDNHRRCIFETIAVYKSKIKS